MTKLRSLFLAPLLPALLLIVIVALGLTLRLTGINWDDDSRLHPDERFMTTIVSRIGDPNNLEDDAKSRCPDQQMLFQFFNTDCSIFNPDNINPGTYAYGTLPLFIVRGAAGLTAHFNPFGLDDPNQWLSYDYIHLVGRVVNALADTLVIILLFMIGRRLFTSWHGLFAAALYAFAVLPIQLSHFWTVDPISNLFFVLGLYAAARVAQQRGLWGYALFGIALGCAVASRINIAPMAALLPIAVLARIQHEERLLQWRNWLLPEIILILGSAALALLVFRIGQPYAFIGPSISNWTISEHWWSEIQSVSDLSRLPSDGWPPSVQWFGRIHYLYPWYEMMMFGMGLVAGIAATLALLAALLHQVVRRQLLPELAMLSLWVVGYFAVTGNLQQMTMRYYLPLYPALFLLGAWFILSLAWLIKTRWRRLLLPAVVVAATVIAGVSFTTSVYTQPITRVEASLWMNNNLTAGIEFGNTSGSRLPVNIQSGGPRLLMQTAYNGESYISDPFQVDGDVPFRLEIQFNDARVTQLQLQWMEANDATDPQVIQEIQLQTDNQGHAEITSDMLPPISPGRYAWHLASQWTPAVLAGAGDQVPVESRSFLPVMEIGSDEITRQPVNFRSPYQSVPYIYIGPETTSVTLQTDQPLTVTTMTLAHIVNPPGPLTITLGDQTYTAMPVDSTQVNVDWNTRLGLRQQYVFDRPLVLKEHTPVEVRSASPIWFTPTAVTTEGDWDDTVPTHFCTYKQRVALGIGLLRDCIDNNSFAHDYFNELKLNMAETDSEVKYRRMVDVLSKSDYFVISSNRFYDAQPRVLRRFSMSTEYYNRLFNSQLGFTLLNTFRRGSDFLGIDFPHEILPTDKVPKWWNEFESEEAFTVYDHPSVFVFQNTGFASTMFPFPPVSEEENTAPPLDLETLPAPTYQLAAQPQTDDDVVFALVIWVIGFVLLGWVAFPLIYALFPGLPLRGYGIARALAWLLLSVVPWWLTSIFGRFFWTRPGLVLLVIAFVILNGVIAYRRRVEFSAYLRANWRRLLVCEIIFGVALAFGLFLRAVNPDLWQIARGGEKPMDFLYLNAILRTPIFPPPNPWMAGFPINYYYFGFVITALPIKLGGIASEVGYNLGLGTLYAVVFSTVFTLAYALLPGARRFVKSVLALVGTLFAMVAGNLGTLKLVVDPEEGMQAHRFYWYPTRILGESANGAGGAINEMPIFSFLFGDLHAHILGLLPTMLFLVGMWALHKQKRWYVALIVGVIAGVMFMTNIWDVLIYIPLAAVLLWLASRSIASFIRYGFLIALGALLTVAPYMRGFSVGGAGGIELWNNERSLIGPFLLVWGIPIGIAALWLLHRIGRSIPVLGQRALQFSLVIIVIVILLALDPILATSALCVIFAGVALLLAWRDKPHMRYIHLGVAVIFVVLFSLEYIVISGDVGRMNTVFKISFQLWMWVGLLIPLILYWMLRHRRYLAVIASLVLIAAGLLFPIYAIPARWDENLSGGLTLDGDRFYQNLGLPEGSVDGDFEIIRYLRAHAQGFPVIAEWYQSEYLWNNRISIQTGLPDVVGWGNHMRQQYGSLLAPLVDQRIQNMQTFFNTGDLNTIRELIQQYNISYIVVGRLERAHASPEALTQFEALAATGDLERVFNSGDSVLYHVVARGNTP